MEQDLKIRLIEDKLREGYYDNKDEVITYLLALQRQAFVMGNSITNLIKHWPNENHLSIQTSQGIPLEIRIKE